MNLPHITSVFLNVTDACNLRCRYCFVEQKPHFMTYKIAKDAADFLIHNAEIEGTIPHITFFGGEPALCWDSIIVPLTNYIRQEYKKPFSLSITSNGTLLSRERLQFMVDNHIGFLFSIDGDKETQDYNRPMSEGKSSFSLLEDKIDLIPRMFPNICFRSTTVPHTCQNIFKNIQFAHSHGYKKFYVVPNVFEEWDEVAKITLQGEMREYTDWLISCFRKDQQPPITFNDFEEALIDIQRINSAIENDWYREEGKCGACVRCGLGSTRNAAIDYKGNIYACQELVSPKEGINSYFCIGNIYTGMNEEARLRLIDDFHREEDRTGHCGQCRLNRICNGGCVANNYMINGNINKPSEVYCWWKNILLDEAIYIANVLGTENNQAFIEYWTRLHNG